MSKLTPFQVKFHELDTLRKDTLKMIAKFNSLHLDYMDWFKRQSQSFIDILKRLQIGAKALAPQNISTIEQFRGLKRVFTENSTASQRQPRFKELLDGFTEFWDRFCILKTEMDKDIMSRFIDFNRSITRLRQPELKDQIDDMYSELSRQHSEMFDFRGVHNEKDNLFTYKIKGCDAEFHGLVNYIPFLTGMSTKMLYLITKVHLETL